MIQKILENKDQFLEKSGDFLKGQNKIVLGLSLIGSLYTLNKLKEFTKLMYFTFRKPNNFKKKYGENTYVCITGTTEGIGKQFAIEFAKLGFNIISISRNQQKLQQLEKLLFQLNSEIKVVSVQADFSKCADDELFFINIMEQIKDLDISILVNNVGIASMTKVEDYTDQELKDQVNINIYSQIFMTKYLVPKFKSRDKRSAIINLSSNSALTFKPYYTVYSGTKAFNLAYSLSLSLELKEKVDVIAACPSMVLTPIFTNKATPEQIKKVRKLMITPEQFVYSVFQRLGVKGQYQTRGHFKHIFQSWVINNMLMGYREKFLIKSSQYVYEQAQLGIELKKKENLQGQKENN